MQSIFSKLVQYQALQLSVSQMHVVAFSGNAFLVGSVFCLTEFTRTELCLLASSWSPGH